MFNVIAAKTRLATITSEFCAQTKPSDCLQAALSLSLCVCVYECASVHVCVSYNLVWIVPSNKDEWALAISAAAFDLQRNRERNKAKQLSSRIPQQLRLFDPIEFNFVSISRIFKMNVLIGRQYC